ncbi:DNA-binding transcriptional regulator, MarR family [Paenibacillus sp. UNC496MF]|uniref:MarR family winged helix-turn-helix transcriptional regulator n=1 Tax=Paenibacillus sp. UNC496MF TaxID=1502753 RepID=UPI0008E0DE8D|nr:MarR family transcriptional regulator [Paenibacillus sp. UNC496MF]SFJ49931.1 DNA-binding transcriptional regulator, MarR family [Paenibacillus sp. UNC496MF]
MDNRNERPAADPADDAFLRTCLFFNANRLSRAVTKIAEEQFAKTGLSPMYGYLVRIVNIMPGITQKLLAEKLYITPSTLTRFIDKLETKQLVERKVSGKTVLVYPTEKGLALEPEIRAASREFKAKYEEVLGSEMAALLSEEMEKTSGLLEK